MSHVDRYVNQVVKVVDSESGETLHTGTLTSVKRKSDDARDLWTQAVFEDPENAFYLTDVYITPVEIDGRRLPDVPGVYSFHRSDYDETLVQLSEAGDWFPYPYLFSGWRAGELFTFDSWKPRPEFTSDIPAILNPEDESQVERLIAELSTLSNVDADEVSALAHKLVLGDRIFG